MVGFIDARDYRLAGGGYKKRALRSRMYENTVPHLQAFSKNKEIAKRKSSASQVDPTFFFFAQQIQLLYIVVCFVPLKNEYGST